MLTCRTETSGTKLFEVEREFRGAVRLRYSQFSRTVWNRSAEKSGSSFRYEYVGQNLVPISRGKEQRGGQGIGRQN